MCLDRVREIPHLPATGGYAEVTRERIFLGGEAANTANALKRWGVEVELAGNSLGSGEPAAELLKLLESHGLPTTLLVTDQSETAVCDIYVTPDGERTMFGRGFGDLGEGSAPEKAPFRRGEWFTVDPNLDDAARRAIRLAEAAGMKLYLMDFLKPEDPIPAGCFWQSSTDWAGVRGNTQKNVQWVRSWVDRHQAFCILSDGPNGLAAGSPNMRARAFPPFPSPEVADSTGAGDMFRAGMLYGLEQGWSIPECLRYASAAGCLKCKSLGATTYVPTFDEIGGLIAENPEIGRQYE